LPEDQDRVIIEVRPEPGEIEPRFTGPANAFDGIVVIRGDIIPPEKIVRVIDPKREEPPSDRAQ
jgi:hypothetical protein